MKEIIRYQDQYYILANSSMVEDNNRVLKNNDLFAIFDDIGNIRPFGFEHHGIYFEGTRFLSRFVTNIEGKHPVLLNSMINSTNDLFVVNYTNPDFSSSGPEMVKRSTVHFLTSFFLNQQRCYKKIKIVNYGLTPLKFSLSFDFEADFVDIFEVRGISRKHRGQLQAPQVTGDTVTLAYEGLDNIVRTTGIHFSIKPAKLTSNSAEFQLDLAPKGESQELVVTISCQSENSAPVPYAKAFDDLEKQYRSLKEDECVVETSNDQFNNWLHRSNADLLMMLTQTPYGLYPYAGIPWFSTVFGRDGIIIALETLWIYPHIARGVLSYLAAKQARDLIPQQDAEPGKILHEVRQGEMANLKEIPFGLYYGSIDSTPLFLILVGRYFERTADSALVEGLWPNILAALKWIDEYGDSDGDGFVEYKQKADGGLVQQGWKDSNDSVFHHNGDLAPPPIALCEVQGYVYEAKMQVAKMARHFNKPDLAEELFQQAAELKKRFEHYFWIEKLGIFAMAIDGNKKPCQVLSSNAGQCLFTGIASPTQAESIAAQLTSDVFYSGWGIRTIATTELRYNPMSYHNGSVWPHDNALIAAGMSRYGLQEPALKVLSGLFETSLLMDSYRLPELFCGFPKRANEGPTLYPVACNPQTWASASVFLMLQACLGLSIDAQHRRVYFKQPVLPPFLDTVKIRNLKVGTSSLNIVLERRGQEIGVFSTPKQANVEIITTR